MLSQSAPISAFLGQLGSTIFNDTTSRSGAWGEIYALSDAAFTTLTVGALSSGSACIVASDSGTVANAVGTLKTGTWIRGYFTTIKLASGSVIAYCV